MTTIAAHTRTNTPAPQKASSQETTTPRGGFYKTLIYIKNNLFSLAVIGVLLFGWANRDDNYLSAETGAGYVLGILGGSTMLILLLYPLSKRNKFFSRLIPIRYWFGFHMILGTIGPVMILFHSNFHMGSTNSNVALFCMLLVAGSGLIGRYIYTHIHHGLYGEKITLTELKKEVSSDHKALTLDATIENNLESEINSIEQTALQFYTGLFASILHAIQIGIRSRKLKRQIIASVHASQAAERDAAINKIDHFTVTLRRVAAFRVYERLFSMWHVLHLPLFIMMIITAIVHVFAVHIY